MTSASLSAPLLVADDSDDDVTAVRWALGKAGVHRPVRRVATGAELLAYLRRTGPYAASGAPGGSARHAAPTPALILLDLNLGPDDGREVLAALKADPALQPIPVVVWTTSAHPDDVTRCYAHGASGYAVKPVDAGRLVETLRDIARYWFARMVLPAVPRDPRGA